LAIKQIFPLEELLVTAIVPAVAFADDAATASPGTPRIRGAF